MSTATTTPRAALPVVGPRVELARYTITTGQRILYGQRVDGNARLIDRPATGRGRAVLVEPHMEHDNCAAMDALIADYVLCRRRHSRYYADPFDMPIRDGEVLHPPRS